MNLLKKIFSPTILIISTTLLIYTFYKSEILWDGNKRNYYKIYYFISLMLIFLSLITFFINYKIKQYLIISCISIIFSLYMFEGYLILDKKLKEKIHKEKFEKTTGRKWDNRSRFRIYEDYKNNLTKEKVVLTVSPENFIKKNLTIFPLAGISNTKTINCNENGYYSIYQSDRYGFNNPDDEWDKQKIEYLLIGDSFAHGNCVNKPNDISSVLRNLSNKSVLNLGYGGNGPLIEYATLREYLNTNVKKIIWIYYEGNDLSNLENEKKDVILNNYINNLDFKQNLKKKQKKINELLTNSIKGNEKKFQINKLINVLKLNNLRYLLISKYRISKNSPKLNLFLDLENILRLAKRLTDKNNQKLYFVYLPAFDRYKNSNDYIDLNLIENILKKIDIPFINIHNEIFNKEKNPLRFFPILDKKNPHYNVNGYKKVAETIYKFTID